MEKYLEPSIISLIDKNIPYAKNLFMQGDEFNPISFLKGRLMTGESILQANALMVYELLKKDVPETVRSFDATRLIEKIKT